MQVNLDAHGPDHVQPRFRRMSTAGKSRLSEAINEAHRIPPGKTALLGRAFLF